MSVHKRDTARNAIARTLAASKKTDYDRSDVESYLSLLKEQWAAFTTAHDLVLESCGVATVKDQENEYQQAEEWYRSALSNLNRMLNRLISVYESSSEQPPGTPTTATAARYPVPRSEVKLPRIDIPSFDGTVKEWIPFRDLFTSLIVNNISLSGSQKLHYLRNGLKGEALQLIKSFQITDANFREAWTVLNNRYDVKRVIVDSHLSALLGISKVTNPNSTSLRTLLDCTQEHLHALKVLDRPVDSWDDWIIHLTLTKADAETHKQWELSLQDNEMPTFATLSSFIEIRCRALEAVECHNQNSEANNKYSNQHQYSKPSKRIAGSLHAGANLRTQQQQTKVANKDCIDIRCPFCNKAHRIFLCQEFLAIPISERDNFRSQKNLCENCLSAGHSSDKCRSMHTCRVCQKRHHTLLHRDSLLPSTPSTSSAVVSNLTDASKSVLLATAVIKIRDHSGRFQTARALLDSASHISFISESCVQRLNLRKTPLSMTIEGIGATPAGTSRGYVSLCIQSINSNFSQVFDTYVLPRVTSELPASQIKTTSWPHISHLRLADPQFFQPSAVDILFGADVMDRILLDGLIKGPLGTPIAQNTELGWVLLGRLEEAPSAQISAPISLYADASLTEIVAKFWEVEQYPESKFLTKEEQDCETIFANTHRRLSNGRFRVNLPFKQHSPLGNSRETAVRALLRMESRFARNTSLHKQYSDFIQEYLTMGHMELAPPLQSASEGCYLPHHAVLKDSSSTTKLRVVFNASMPTSTGVSLNDTQMVGPSLQAELGKQLLKFRMHRYVLTGDIEKMYRQVLVKREDAKYQRIVWRESPTNEIQDYRLLTVTYGISSSSYLAVKALQQCATDGYESYPRAAEVILNDFYMDDLLTGSYDIDELRILRDQIDLLLKKGCFQIRKWASNNLSVIEDLPIEHREVKTTLQFGDSTTVKALGLEWKPAADHLVFTNSLEPMTSRVTKRNLLSDSARIFDPLGLLSPTTITAKILFQQLWRPKVDWDQEVPADILESWTNYRQNLHHLNELLIPRWLFTGKPGSVCDLHGFSDASQLAYAAAVFARVESPDGSTSVTLICAKTRLAPLKTRTLPQLELCGAALLTSVISYVKEALNIHFRAIYGWSDSTVSLAWINKCPSKCVTFVANRVSTIQKILPAEHWRHVPSKFNPADCATRGVPPNELANLSLWWSGPSWLRSSEVSWPEQPTNFTTTLGLRRDPTVSSHAISADNEPEILRVYSSYRKLKRIVAYILRFCHNTKHSSDRRTGDLSSNEIYSAQERVIVITQSHYFQDDISRLKSGNPLLKRSNLIKLRPYLDAKGILRVGGRLRNANASIDVRHPILLSAKSALTTLICRDIHRISLHAGPQSMQAMLQQRYWVPGARRLVRKIAINCPTCIRQRHQQSAQLMADLPSIRVQRYRPFLHTGVDFAGPFRVRMSRGRGINASRSTKCYVAVFICMSTGAIHLELSSDLSSSTFIAALKRFSARRGHCQHLYSDNGTNFVGADRDMRELMDQVKRDEKTRDFLSGDFIEWHFNPPSAPHMGGFWEAAVKRLKYHLRRTLAESSLTYEEFYTLLVEVEACQFSTALRKHQRS